MAGSSSNVMPTVSWSFTALSSPSDVPIIRDQLPSPDAIGQVLQPTISFDVIDTHDIALATLDVTVDSVLAVDAGVIQAGWSGSITPISEAPFFGYAVSVVPDTPFAKGATIPVQVDVDHDTAPPDPQTFNWTFYTVSENLTFTMRADKFQGVGPIGFVFWEVPDAPDPTGALSPYDPGDLQDVVVLARNPAETYYTMRAWDTINLEYVYWTGTAPDPAGTNAPVPSGQLQDIIVGGGSSFVDSPITLGPFPTTLQPVLGEAFSFTPSVDNPTGGPFFFSFVAGSLPNGLNLNVTTGEISGTPTVTGLLTNAGLYTGIQLQVTNGVQTDVSPVFSIDVQGVAIPGPDLYVPADANGNDASGQGKPNPIANLVNFPGGNGNVGGAADFAFATSYLDYGDNPDYRVNANAAITISSTVNPRTFPVGGSPRIADHTDGSGVGWSFGVSPSGVPEMTVRYATADATAVATSAVLTGAHTQVSATWTASANRSDLFVGGVQETLTSDITGVGALGDDTGEDLFLGNDAATMTNEWDGTLDETALWAAELDANQHATLGWLKLRQVSIISWANQAPTAVSYAAREVTVNTAMTLAPTLPAVDPEALPVTYALASGTLPDGLSLDVSTGVISGTPTITALLSGSPAGEYVLTVEGDDGVNQTESAPFLIAVRGVELPDPVFYGPFDTSGVDPVKAVFPTNTNVTFPGGNGNVDGAADFAASDSNLDYGSDADYQIFGKAALTVSATVNPRSFPNASPRIISHEAGGDGWAFNFQSTGELTFFFRGVSSPGDDGGAVTTAAIPTATQTQVSATWTLASLRAALYIEGVSAPLSTDLAGNNVDDDTGGSLLVGNISSFLNRAHDGTIDEVAIWAADFTAEQHATLGWLKLRQESLASWIRDEVPVGPTYNDQVFDPGAVSFTPVAAGFDPEGETIAYLSASDLPPGLSLNTTTGEISGTMGGVGEYTPQVNITDGMHIVAGPSFTVEVTFGAADMTDSFEFAESWPDTIANPFPDALFTTSSVTDSFENLDGWPGT